jgi:hypothetical protein
MTNPLSSEPLLPNRPDVIDETFDGEAVIVHLSTGSYFALSPAASELWKLLSAGRSPASLAASVDVEPEVIAAFVEQIQEELLVVPAESDLGPLPAPLSVDGAPTIEKFTDMQDLLMLDPIHDIELDGDGWPVAREA